MDSDLTEQLYRELKYATQSIHSVMHEHAYQGDRSLNVPLLDCPHENCRKRLALLAAYRYGCRPLKGE